MPYQPPIGDIGLDDSGKAARGHVPQSNRDPWSYVAAKQENRYMCDILTQLRSHVDPHIYNSIVRAHPLHRKMAHLHLVDDDTSLNESNTSSEFPHPAMSFGSPTSPSGKSLFQDRMRSRGVVEPVGPASPARKSNTLSYSQGRGAAPSSSKSMSSSKLGGSASSSSSTTDAVYAQLRHAEELERRSESLYAEFASTGGVRSMKQ